MQKIRKIIHKSVQKLGPRRFKALSQNNDGATAIEFAILAIPFFMLLFAVIELAIIFFISSSLNNAVITASRNIRTGNFQNCGKAKFKTLVCQKMQGGRSCMNNVRIDVVSDDDFTDITLPAAPLPTGPTVTNGDYDESEKGDSVIVRAYYYYPLVLPSRLTLLENLPGSGKHLITATTAFRNEPFGVDTCPV